MNTRENSPKFHMELQNNKVLYTKSTPGPSGSVWSSPGSRNQSWQRQAPSQLTGPKGVHPKTSGGLVMERASGFCWSSCNKFPPGTSSMNMSQKLPYPCGSARQLQYEPMLEHSLPLMIIAHSLEGPMDNKAMQLLQLLHVAADSSAQRVSQWNGGQNTGEWGPLRTAEFFKFYMPSSVVNFSNTLASGLLSRSKS